MAHSSCPNCWRTLKESEARFCQHCGLDLSEWSYPAVPFRPPANRIALKKTPITIGRDGRNDVQLDHPAVSGQHARLEWRAQEGAWYVVDEESARGTFVNYQRVPQGLDGRPIDPTRDTIWIAPYSFELVSGERDHQPGFEPAHLRVDAQGLVCTVKHETTGKPFAILDLTGTPLSFRPGEFIALVGGSGVGKSTLVKALLGLAPAQQGTVYIGKRPFIRDGQAQRFEAMHTVVGYVPQEDVVHLDLTASEAMAYTARLRLSPDLSPDERARYVRETLETIDLWPHRDKLIRKLSGGQRKRVNIALELLARPRLLFLDEPTSGLDPGLDLAIMELLRDWATDPADPRTIVLITHATENVTKCKYVAFLASGGQVVYFGPPDEALEYFDRQQFAEIYQYIGVFKSPDLATGQAEGDSGGDVRQLSWRFRNSPQHFRYVEARALDESEAIPDADVSVADDDQRSLGLRPAERSRLWRQFKVVAARYWKLIRRDRMNFVTLLLQGFLVAGLLWAVARPDTFQPKGAEDAETMLFIMACAAAWLGILNATKEIVKEQDIYSRERRYGLGAAPYVLSKLTVLSLVGAIQMGALLLLVGYRFTLPEHGALGAWSPAGLEWFITLELTLIAGLSLGLFLSALTKTMDAATAIMFVLLLIQVMFAGLFFPDAPWADVFSVFAFSRWALEAAGTTANLNRLLGRSIGSSYRAVDAYTFSALHLVIRWAILSAYAFVFTLAASLRQASKR
jgi:ABC-type multidrug transport system ATPase subunit